MNAKPTARWVSHFIPLPVQPLCGKDPLGSGVSQTGSPAIGRERLRTLVGEMGEDLGEKVVGRSVIRVELHRV